MARKEQDLKIRLAGLLRDLQGEARQDPEAFVLIGSLAATLIDKSGAPSWPALKNSLTAEDYDKLLYDFRSQGNALAESGEGKKVYAIQALAISLICSTQRKDFQMREGEVLLDRFIAGAVEAYRNGSRPA